MSVIVATVAVVHVISMISWSKVAVVMKRSMSVVLWKVSLAVVTVPVSVSWNSMGKWSVIVTMMTMVSLMGNSMVNSVLEVWILLLMSVNLVGNSMTWVVEVSVVWTNISIMMVIEMHLSSVVVWLEVDIVLHGVALNLMDNWVNSMVSPVGVGGLVSPESMVSGSMKKVMNTNIVVSISRWMVHWGSIVVSNVAVVMKCIIVGLRGVMVGVIMNVFTIMWLNISPLVS